VKNLKSIVVLTCAVYVLFLALGAVDSAANSDLLSSHFDTEAIHHLHVNSTFNRIKIFLPDSIWLSSNPSSAVPVLFPSAQPQVEAAYHPANDQLTHCPSRASPL
jgi:hypothetical protein